MCHLIHSANYLTFLDFQNLVLNPENNPILIVISVVKRIKKVYKVFIAFGNTSKNGRA